MWSPPFQVRTAMALGLTVNSQYMVVAVAAGSDAHGKFEVRDQLVKLNCKPLSGGGPFVTQWGSIAVGGKANIELVRTKVA